MENDKIEEAFQETSQVLLGYRLSGLTNYRDWLLHNVSGPIQVKSEISNKIVFVPNLIFYTSIKRNMVKLEETLQLGERKLDIDTIHSLTISNASVSLEGIKFVTSEVVEGENSDVRNSAAYLNAHHCMDGVFYVFSKYDAYCFWPRETDHAFGCHYLFASSFCIQCHNSVALRRCFEVSDSNKCSDCYFCHNCENLTDCMFCFNIKSKRYAIGNIEVGREKYLEIKKRFLEEIANKLERDKKLDLSIYTFGSKQ